MDWIKQNKIWIICATVVVIVAAVGYLYWSSVKTQQGAATTMQYEDTTDPAALKPKLGVSAQEAGEIATKIVAAQQGGTSRRATYYITSPNVQQAATDTTKAINNNDPALPMAAVEKTDRTVVTADTDKQKVDVYKINLRNNHKLKAGVTVADSKAYPTIAYQAGRVEVAVLTDGRGVQGGTVLYTVKEW